MDQQLKKGVLEIYVLAFLKRNDSYGYKIIQFLSPLISVSESTLYPILRRLNAFGYLSTYTLVQNGRVRNYYHVTPRGEQRLMNFATDIQEIVQTYDLLLKRASN